jgi:hypothetical protein
MLLVVGLSSCSRAEHRSERLGIYVSQVCEAIRPFERDAQRFGRVLGHGLDVGTGERQEIVIRLLTGLDNDTQHVVKTLEAVDYPGVRGGAALAEAMALVFEEIQKSYAVWRSRLVAGDWAWPRRSRMVQEQLRPAIMARLLVGHQMEALPLTRESQDAMRRSVTCRNLFGRVSVGE